MAGGGDEARLRDVGVIGFGLGAAKLGVEPRQFAGALAHAALQRGVGAFKRFGGLHARRNVGEGRDQTAVGHTAGAHLDHQPALGEALEERLGLRGVAGDARGDFFVEVAGVAGGGRAALGDVAEDFVERDADARERVRQVENFAELPVPAQQRQILVEHGNALAHVIEGGLQYLPVVVDRGVGIVEELERRLGRNGALAQQQRKHEPRRGGADRRSQQIFAVLQEQKIGLGARFEADTARGGKAAERFARALFAEIAGDGGGEFLDGHRRAPQPEARRHRSERGRHEHVGLHAFDRAWPAGEGAADIERDVGEETEHDALHQRRQIEAEQRLRPQPGKPERPGAQDMLADHAGVGDARQQERIGPDQDARRHAGNSAGRGAAPPDQSAKESGRQLRNGGKG